MTTFAPLTAVAQDVAAPPDLVGLLGANAEVVAAEAGFEIEIKFVDSAEARGTVLGQMVPKEGRIQIEVSDGIAVPEGLVGLPAEVAIGYLEALDLTVVLRLRTRDCIGQPVRVRQEVVGTNVTPGQRIDATTESILIVVGEFPTALIPSDFRINRVTMDQIGAALEALCLVPNLADRSTPYSGRSGDRCLTFRETQSTTIIPDRGSELSFGSKVAVERTNDWRIEQIFPPPSGCPQIR